VTKCISKKLKQTHTYAKLVIYLDLDTRGVLVVLGFGLGLVRADDGREQIASVPLRSNL
jgi:hypothetical protein